MTHVSGCGSGRFPATRVLGIGTPRKFGKFYALHFVLITNKVQFLTLTFGHKWSSEV